MLWIANGLAYVFMKGEVIYGLPAGFRQIGTGMLGPIPGPDRHPAGDTGRAAHPAAPDAARPRRFMRSAATRTAARLSGMPVERRLVIVYALSGLMARFASLLIIARTNAADVSLGEEQLLPAIAAVCLGGTSLFGGVGGVAGTAVGAIILALGAERHEPARREDVLAGRRARHDHSGIGAGRPTRRPADQQNGTLDAQAANWSAPVSSGVSIPTSGDAGGSHMHINRRQFGSVAAGLALGRDAGHCSGHRRVRARQASRPSPSS